MAEIGALIEGGKASAGPPLGPALGPMGINTGQVVAAINEKTKDFAGMKVPVTVIVDEKTKTFEIEIGTPPTSALIKKELGVEKGASKHADGAIGNLSMEQALKVARMKHDAMNSNDLKASLKQVVGSCVPLGCTVDGRTPQEVGKDIDTGKFDSLLA